MKLDDRRPRGSAYIRDICFVEGCTHLQSYKVKDAKGVKTYRKLCTMHHQLKYKGTHFLVPKIRMNQEIPNKKCIRCGWDGPCDRHRIVPEKGYYPDNVLVLCPNCHRLETLREEEV